MMITAITEELILSPKLSEVVSVMIPASAEISSVGVVDLPVVNIGSTMSPVLRYVVVVTAGAVVTEVVVVVSEVVTEVVAEVVAEVVSEVVTEVVSEVVAEVVTTGAFFVFTKL